jgi:chromosome partitioning protein
MDIAFVADKGGVGKTTLAYHVATRLRQLGHDVALVDLDRRSASTWWAGQADRPYFPAYPLDELNGSVPDHPVRVWDTPAHIGAAIQDRLAALCSAIVVVTQPDAVSYLAAADLYTSLSERGDAALAVLLNGAPPTAKEDLSPFERAGVRHLATVVRRYSCYGHSQWDGQAVCDYPYPSADNAWSDITALTDEILALVEEHDAA